MMKIDFKKMTDEELREHTKKFLDGYYEEGGIEKCMEAAIGTILGALESDWVDEEERKRIAASVVDYLDRRIEATDDPEELRKVEAALYALKERTMTMAAEALKAHGIDPDARSYDLIKTGMDLLERMMEDGSCPPEILEKSLKDTIQVIMTTVDQDPLDERDRLTQEEEDFLMEKCAEYRKRLMELQDRENAMQSVCDRMLFRGYTPGTGEFSMYR